MSQRETPTNIIFDIDNVLVDTRESYFDAIRWTVEIYLTEGKIPFFTPSSKFAAPAILTAEDVDQFKRLGGFNDDWDCCYGLLIYILSLPVKTRTVDHLRDIINIQSFSRKVKTRPLRVNGIVKMLGRPGAVMIEKIARIFQEVYLGKELFQAQEHRRPIYWKKRGLIHKEKLIFRRSTLEKLKSMGVRLGIATGRSRFEALFALKLFGIEDMIDSMTTIDEVRKAEKEQKCSLRKPHPFSLLETAKHLGEKHRFFYIGDLPDDILAANEAKSIIDIRSVGFPHYSADPTTATKELEKAGSDFILEKPSELINLIKK